MPPMLMVEATIDRLNRLIANELDINVRLDEIDPDAPLLDEGLKLDSLAVVELITLSEETFGIQFGEEDLNIRTFASLRALAQVIDARRQVAVI